MADDRTFTLIGNFTDNITPALERINTSLAQTQRAFASFGSKRGGVDTLTKSLGKVIGAHIRLKEQVKELRSEMQKSLTTMGEYNRLMGKAIGANIRMQRSTSQAFGQQARDIAATNAQLRQRNTLTRAANRGGGGGGSTRRPPGPPGPPGPPRTPRTPRMSGGYGGGGGGGGTRRTGGGGSTFGESVMKYAFAQQVATVVEAGIMSGFRGGVALFQTSFKYIGDSFRERIEDQMTDLQAAGGNLSIASRQKNPFVKNLTESIRFTQATNKTLAVLANDLPGDTQDYIEVGKRIGDSVAQLVDFDKKGAAEFAKRLQKEGNNAEVYKNQQITGDGGSEDIKSTITTIVGELTKKTVISGFGGSVGVGGIKGPNSLAGIMERLITDPSMSLGKISKYAATFDPKVLSALKRAMPALDAAGADLLKRAKIVNSMLDEIATPEMISAMRRSVAGILEAFRGAFLNPEVGFLGFGRKLKEGGAATASMVDAMGNYVKIMKDGEEQIATENLSIFELIGDLMANYGAILKPLVDSLYEFFDPLKQLGDVLAKAREASIKLFHQFRNYVAGLDGLKGDFKGTKNLRASLLTLTNLFTNMGIFSEGDFSRLQKILVDPKKTMGDLGKVFSEIVNTFFNSDAAKKLGEFFGTLLGTIAVELSKMTGFFADKVGGGKLADGFTSAFNAAGGGEAVSKIFEDIFTIIFDNLGKILREAPWQAKVFAGVVLILPILAQGLAFAVAELLQKLFGGVGRSIKTSGGKALQRVGRSIKASGGEALTKMKGKTSRITAGQISPFAPTLPNNTRGVGVSNPSFRAIPRVARANAQFPNVAMPGGVQRGVGGVTGPFKAPKTFTPSPEMAARAKASRARGAKALMRLNFLRANEAIELKNAVGPLKKITKNVGKLGLAFAALDVGIRLASGDNIGTAALGAGGSLAGGAIGAVVGQTLLPFLPGIGAIIGSIVGAFLGDWAATQLPNLFKDFPAKLTAAFTAVTKWFDEAPEKFGFAVGKFTASLGSTWNKLGPVFSNIGLKFKGWTQTLTLTLQNDWDKFIASVSSGGTIDWNKLGTTLAAKLKEAFNIMQNVVDPVSFGLKMGADFFNKFMNFFRLGFNSQGTAPAMRTDQEAKGMMKYDGKTRAPRPLSSAIASEMRNKPSGSDLVIANSSETVIPAAGGYGVKELMDILVDGFSSIKKQYTSLATGVNKLDTKTSKEFQTVNKTIDTNQNQNQQEFAKINQNFQQLSTKVSSMSMGGMGGMGDMGGLGAGYGSAGGQIAGQLGNFIKQTGGAPGSIHEHPQHGGVKYKHSPKSYHYQGRAIDIGGYANEQAGILRRIAQFNAMYGVKPVELFHAGNDPAGHSDHVHVAYAYGSGNPAFFSSQKDAQSFENKLIPSNVKSITSNTGEIAGLFDGLFGQKPKERKPGQKPTMNELGTETGYKMLQRKKAMEDAMKLLNQSSYISPDRMAGQSGQIASNSAPANITNTITIQQLPGQDANQLAEIVARKIGQAIADVQSSSLFV